MTSSDPMGEAARRAYATLRASLAGELWDDDAGRVAHARTLVMIGRVDDADAVLAEGGFACAVARMHLHHAHDDWERAVAVGREAIARFPAHAVGLRNSVASMLSGLGRHDEALVLIEDNVAAEPEVATWAELRALLVERMSEDEGEDAA